MNDEPEVISRIEGRVGRITLNRPKALHALNLSMCEAMITALQAWRNDPSVALVMIDHAGERGFCAGGDIRMLAESGAKDGKEAIAFFHTEYRLNHLLFIYEKPVVAVMDGIVMGGGVGLAMPCAYRIATERTTFAMPETGIGLFPDVGGGWFLPRLPGKTGLWLALTGARLKAADCLILGIATDYVESARLEDLKAGIIADPAKIEGLLAQLDSDPGHAPLSDHLAVLSDTFSMTSVEGVVAALEAQEDQWAKAQLEALKAKSPQTLKVAFRQLQLGARMNSFADNMAMEYAIGARVVRRHDFLEGVRAVIVDKDGQPRWNPDRLDKVTEAMLDAIFAPLPSEEAWTPLT